jgi:hypothetical protein
MRSIEKGGRASVTEEPLATEVVVGVDADARVEVVGEA